MTHALNEVDALAPYRPHPHTLMLMLRASAIADGRGGPWLTLTRAHGSARVFQHHIGFSAPTAYSPDRVLMCSGVELLGKYCSITRGVPANITEPTGPELRELGTWCCERVKVALWDEDVHAWARWYMGPIARDKRAAEADDAASRVRSLRWLLAEEWLR
jgi:hypothetical protein